jgi:actin-like ATPase involved in cell morphogenesis
VPIAKCGHPAIRVLHKLVVATRPPSDRFPPDASDGIPIVDITELGDLSSREAAMLDEDVDLLPWEKRRMLAVVRALESGELYDLLDLVPGASVREIKRAYFELSKQLHPDRYYGKRLGSFAPLFDRVFAALSQLVKTLADSRTVTAGGLGPSGPRRRRAERVVFHAPVAVARMTHIGPVQLETIDLGRGGAFLATDSTPTVQVGQPLDLLVQPTGVDPLSLRATVAWVQPSSPAEREEDGPPTGFGVSFEPPSDECLGQLDELIALARRVVPAATGELVTPSAPSRAPVANTPAAAQATRFARGTARLTLARRVIGIDFGTTYTSVAAALANRVQILPWADGSRAIPSVIAFSGNTPGAQVVVGAEARARQLGDPRHVVPSVKRLLGRQADDPEVAPHLGQASYAHSAGPDGGVVIEMFGEPYATPQLCAFLLDAARRNAERVLEQPVEQAVVTVPVSFTPERVQLLRRAGQLAHLDIIEVIEEPNAAALACRHTPEFGGLIGVYDFGGGTFDFSVVDATGGDFRVLTAVGDTWLGGDDLDYAVAEAAANLFWRVHGVDLRMRAVEWQNLLLSAEKAKRDLSMVDAATLFVPEVLHNAQGPQDLRIKVARDRVEPIWHPVIDRTIHTCTSALGLLGLRPSDLTAIYLAGGTSYVPAVRRALSHRFQVPVRIGAPPDHAVCLGAGMHAAQLERRIPTLLVSR